MRRQFISIATLAAASLVLESSLTRLLAVSQFYHFAFLVVSLALLGYGASGSILFLLSKKFLITETKLNHFIRWMGIGFSICNILVYAVVNFLPFDSYSIAWDRRQLLIFCLNYLILTLPFILSGAATGAALSAVTGKKHMVYAANLLGSGIGVCIGPIAMFLSGVPGAVLLSTLMGLMVTLQLSSLDEKRRILQKGILLILFLGTVLFGYLAWENLEGNSSLGLVVSPYKGLAQALRVPGAERIFGRWNAISRVDLLQDAGIHRLPGLSYLYSGVIPDQIGLSIDAEAPHPITLTNSGDFEASGYLPESIIFNLFQNEEVLVIEPAGGLGVLQALSGEANKVTVTINNPLLVDAINQSVDVGDVYKSTKIDLVNQSNRSYLQSNDDKFDIIYFPLVDPYRPIASGAFSLSENYDLTIESFMDVIDSLKPGGVLVITRWLQTPPSESIRVFATLIEAATEVGIRDLKECFVAFRGIQTMTIILKPSKWNQEDLHLVREFISSRKYDLVWSSDLSIAEVNQNNVLPEPQYYLLINDLLESPDRYLIYLTYPFDISPPTDSHPFFYHFFRWGQTREIIATLGHTWQPFGGSGFLVLFALLMLVIIISLVLILLPLLISKKMDKKAYKIQTHGKYLSAFLYFSFLGFAFLFIEIPLIQKTILLVGHPFFAFTLVVFTILFFSGLGSATARTSFASSKLVMILLPIFTVSIPIFYDQLIQISLGWSELLRFLIVILSLAPLAFLMGFPFPYGLTYFERENEKIIPWIWAVNGSISVAASVIAAILILSYDFNVVLILGSTMYFAASVVFLFGFRNMALR